MATTMALVLSGTGRTAEDRRLSALSADFGAPIDAALQRRVEAIDRALGDQLGIAADQRACGVFDLTNGRLALVRPDAIFYGASVPKIVILLGYFETHPEAGTQLDPQVQRELERMIKRSDNALAAKYAQLVGLDKLQEVAQLPRYRLYDASGGGGLWCGKYYDIDQPRRGDPLGDCSHAATVRQCLRYYVMLERGELVNAAASAKMKEIFCAPSLDFDLDDFVDGLRGRNISIIRKNGEWEDWHLDTARVQHDECVYLIAAMAHHPRGKAYLAGFARAIDEELRGPQTPPPFEHKTISQYKREHFAGKSRIAATRESSSFDSEVVRPELWFNEVLPSWNIKCPPSCGFSVEIRVGREAESVWTPWLYAGEWGDLPPDLQRTTECPLGKIDVDYFRSEQRFNVLDYRVTSYDRRPGSPDTPAFVELDRMSFCLSDTTRAPLARIEGTPGSSPCTMPQPPLELPNTRLPVPPRSQKVEDAALAGRICSPTSLAMLLAYRGVDRPTREVLQRAFDPAHDLYGNWPRNIQAAYSFGVPGFIKRFADWRDVTAQIEAGQPLVISVQVEEGELHGSPYKSTDGHLLVLCGFDEHGDVCVNDPAAPPDSVQRTYKRAELERVWFERGKGTAYVLLPRP